MKTQVENLESSILTLKNDAVTFLTHDSAIVLGGQDSRQWLQGQITNDLLRLTPSQPLQTCFCNPTGQFLTVASIYCYEDSILMITPHPQIILDRISNFVIMEDVFATQLDEPVYSIQGARASGIFARNRTGFGGYDVIGEISKHYELPESHLNVLEIAAQIPRWGLEVSAKTLPPELGSYFEANHISYTKGCYVGQEVLQRIHSRGHTNKTLVTLLSDAEMSVGTAYANNKDIGVIHRAGYFPSLGYIASATLKNDFTAIGTIVQVADTNKEEAVVIEPPLFGY